MIFLIKKKIIPKRYITFVIVGAVLVLAFTFVIVIDYI